MLFLGIDQHACQLTSHCATSTVTCYRLVRSRHGRRRFWSSSISSRGGLLSAKNKFIAVVEVCGFNAWLIQMLRDDRCHKVILTQPEERKRCKTD